MFYTQPNFDYKLLEKTFSQSCLKITEMFWDYVAVFCSDLWLKNLSFCLGTKMKMGSYLFLFSFLYVLTFADFGPQTPSGKKESWAKTTFFVGFLRFSCSRRLHRYCLNPVPLVVLFGSAFWSENGFPFLGENWTSMCNN